MLSEEIEIIQLYNGTERSRENFSSPLHKNASDRVQSRRTELGVVLVATYFVNPEYSGTHNPQT